MKILKNSMSCNRRKKALSSIIGATILFGILLTVGFGYFYSITQAQQYYQFTVKQQNLATAQKNAESLILTSAIVSNQIQITIYNVGIITNITSLLVTNNSTGTLQFLSLPGGKLVPQGGYTSIGGIIYVPGDNYLIKALTARGNIFETTYPPITSSLATQALTSGSLGDIYMSFDSYTYFNVTSGSGCPASGGIYSGYCLSNGLPAFTIPNSVSNNPIGFAVTMTDLNGQSASIVLDQFTLMYENVNIGGPNGKNPFVAWYVVSNSTNLGHNAILNSYTPVILKYNVPTTVVFASSNCVPTALGEGPNDCSGQFATNAQHQSAGTVTPVFMMMHGWESTGTIILSTLTYAAANYGQNMPYVSTLYS